MFLDRNLMWCSPDLAPPSESDWLLAQSYQHWERGDRMHHVLWESMYIHREYICNAWMFKHSVVYRLPLLPPMNVLTYISRIYPKWTAATLGHRIQKFLVLWNLGNYSVHVNCNYHRSLPQQQTRRTFLWVVTVKDLWQCVAFFFCYCVYIC